MNFISQNFRIGTGIGVGRETPRDINREWEVDFSHNIFDNNHSEIGNTFESIGGVPKPSGRDYELAFLCLS